MAEGGSSNSDCACSGRRIARCGSGRNVAKRSADRIALYGLLELTRDKQGLRNAQALKALLDQTVEHLQAEENVPEAVPAPSAPKKVRNPFT